ncbi:MAG: hypothetical protein QOD01_2217 [Actinomycetota bacterium]|jgi:hypothetical protein|nr:hypothetical protein [Actinomycetota bacterium]
MELPAAMTYHSIAASPFAASDSLEGLVENLAAALE